MCVNVGERYSYQEMASSKNKQIRSENSSFVSVHVNSHQTNDGKMVPHFKNEL